MLFVGPKAQAILLPYLLRAADKACFSPQESEQQRLDAKHAARVTPEGRGNVRGSNRTRRPRTQPTDQFTSGTYARSIRNVCNREDIPAWSPNQLRHSAATEIRKKEGIETSQLILGHSSIDVTQIYAEQDLERGDEWALKHG